MVVPPRSHIQDTATGTDLNGSKFRSLRNSVKCLINGLTGKVKHYFKWTVSQLIGT